MKKREKEKRDRPSWNEFFMFSAVWAAARASCLHLQTGAVIVKDKRIIASGYNGAPPGIENCFQKGCRKEEYGVLFDEKGKGVCRGLHAEVNAMSQIARQELKGTKMYSLYLPCSACAKEIVGNGIAEVIYSKIYKEEDILTREMFKEARVKLRKLPLDVEKYFEIIRKVIEDKTRD